MIRQEESLAFHAAFPPGKVGLRPTKACLTPREMRLVYLPGASFPCQAIAEAREEAFRLTSRGNLVGVVTDGSAVPGLGNVGPEAAKPMQEGMAVLFKRLADIDVFDLELGTQDPDRFVEVVQMLEPTFGGINLKDIRAPEGLVIYDTLTESLNIPVFHENLYSTAVVAAAALLNALALVEKQLDAIQVVLCGAGTVGTGCARLFLRLGVRPENLLVYDVNGLLHPDRGDLHPFQRDLVREHPARTLAEGIRGADVFVGASAGGVLDQAMIRSMSSYPVVFALATPEPEIRYEEARAARRDVIVATSLGRDPNAVVDLLSFPYIFRGALDVHATRITEEMLLAAARSLAELAREDVVEEVDRAYGDKHFSFGPEYLLPKPVDPRILVWESAAVAARAVEEGVALHPVRIEAYQESLSVRLGTGRETLRHLMLKARQEDLSVVFSEGTNETILRATSILTDEGIARPILLGDEEEVHLAMNRLGLDLGGVPVIDPSRSLRFDAYVDEYFHLRGRRGVMRAAAARKLRQPDYFAAMMLHSGDADLMLAGLTTHYAASLGTILEVVGPEPGGRRISSVNMVLLPKNVYFLADCAVEIDPSAEDLAETALLAAGIARSLGVEPVVAMLSFSNFGSVDHPLTRKVREASRIARERAPDLVLDGEMQLATALKAPLRQEYFPFTELKSDANVLIFPDLQSGNLALNVLQHMAETVSVGPILTGTRLPVHLLQYGATVEEVVNLIAVGVVEAAARKRKAVTLPEAPVHSLAR